MPSYDNQTHGHGSREYQADGAPQLGPEHRRNHQIRTWQFLPMPQRFRQIQAVLLSARLAEKLLPNLTLFHLILQTNRINWSPWPSFAFELPGHVQLIKVRQPAMAGAPVSHASCGVSLGSDSCSLSPFWTFLQSHPC